MKHHICWLAAFLFLFLSSAQSQYLLWDTKGKITDSASGKILHKGDKVSKTATLIISKGANALFICPNSNAFHIYSGDARNIKLSTSDSDCAKEGDSWVRKYFAYVLNDLSHEHHNDLAEHRLKYVGLSGGVSRGKQTAARLSELYDTINYVSGELPIYWQTDTAKKISFRLYEADEATPVMDTVITGTCLKLATACRMLEPGKIYQWDLYAGNETHQPRHTLNIYSTAAYDSVLAGYKQQASTIADKAESDFLLGFLLESHHFLQAGDQYKLAAKSGKEDYYNLIWNNYTSMMQSK